MINLKLGHIKNQLPKNILNKFCKEVFKDVNLYPQNYDILISRLAKKHNVTLDNIVLINGVDEGVELIVRVFGKDTLIFSPSYYEFEDAPKRNKLKYEMIDCFDGKKYNLKYKEEDVKNRSLIFLCNPNNPFGLLSKKETVYLANKTKGIVAVDETYIDFNGETVINEFNKTPNILVLRSFSKGYSLAGLRIGYITGQKDLIDKIKERKLYCNVTSVSVYATMIAMDEEKYFKKLIDMIKEKKDNFEEFLKNKGVGVIHTYTNNMIIKFKDKNKACDFYNYLKNNKILVNQGNGMSTCGLDETFIRFVYGTDEEMKKFKGIIEKYSFK